MSDLFEQLSTALGHTPAQAIVKFNLKIGEDSVKELLKELESLTYKLCHISLKIRNLSSQVKILRSAAHEL